MTFPISRQGLEQIAIVLAVGAVLFGLLALIRWRRADVVTTAGCGDMGWRA